MFSRPIYVYLDMNLPPSQFELIKRLLETEDEDLLQPLRQVLNDADNHFWIELPDFVKEGVLRAKRRVELGMPALHEQVLLKYAGYL